MEAISEKIVAAINDITGQTEDCEEMDDIQEHDREQMRWEIEGIGIDADSFDDDDIDTLLLALKQGPHAFLAELMSMSSQKQQQAGSDTGDDDEFGQGAEEDNGFSSFFEEDLGSSFNDDPFGRGQDRSPQDVLSKKSINTFYKKIAQRIHPDKAKDDRDRQRRNQLMQVLTQAKKENDAFTIFNLYQQHVDSTDLDFSDNEFNALIALLQNKLHALQKQKRELKNDSGINAVIYQRFQARSKRETNERLTSHKQFLEQWITTVAHDTKSISSIKQLKVKLQSRINEENRVDEDIIVFPQY